MSAIAGARAAQFGSIIGLAIFLAGCPDSPELGEIRPPAPPPDFSIKVDFGFEEGEYAVNPDGTLSVGTAPVTAKFSGGQVVVPENPDLVRERAQAWLIGEGETAEITFASPAKSFELFFRNELEPPATEGARASRQDCGVIDLGLNNGAAFGSEIFVRGAFNSWAGASSEPPTGFVNNGDGTYSAEFAVVSGTSPFKIASEDWSIEYSNSGSETIVPDGTFVIPLSGAGSDNSVFDIAADGCYTWTISNVDTSGVPSPAFDLTVSEKVDTGGGGVAGSEIKVYDTYGEEIASFPGTTLYRPISEVRVAGETRIARIEIINTSSAPAASQQKQAARQDCGVVDQGNDNTEAFGEEFYFRGGFNDWAGAESAVPNTLINFGDGNYQTQFELTVGTYEFKIANEGWTNEYSDGGALALQTPTEIALNGGAGNTSVEIPEDGCYSFNIDIVDDTSVPAPTIELTVSPVSDNEGPAGETGIGFVAIDDFEFRADPQASRAIRLFYLRPDGDFSATVFNVSGDIDGGAQELNCVPVPGVPGVCSVLVRLQPGGDLTYSIFNDGVADEAGEITVNAIDITPDNGVITFSGSRVPVTRALPVVPAENQVILFYKRDDDNYDGWGLHLFPITSTDWTFFDSGEYPPSGIDPELGAYFIIGLPGSPNLSEPYSRCETADSEPGCDLSQFPETLGFIIHNGPNKDPGPDQFININEDGPIVFVRSGVNTVSTTPPVDGGVVVADAAAHWVQQDTLLWSHGPGIDSVALAYSADASIREAGGRLIGVDMLFELSAGSRPDLPNARHIEGRTPYTVPADAISMASQLVKGQLLAVASDAFGNQVKATVVQFPLLLDDLYAETAADATLGVTYSGATPSLALWAPTSTAVEVNIYDAATDDTAAQTVPMTLDDTTGIWHAEGTADWDRKYYTYAITNYVPAAGRFVDHTVTDPYSVNLSLASDGRLVKSQMVNLDDVDLKPVGWDALIKPDLEAPEDISIYELHIRDFSALDSSVMPDDRGRYGAFAGTGSGTEHLAALAAAGLTHVHILPAFDFATINEDASERVDIDNPIEDLCAVVPEAQSFCDDYAGMSIAEIMESFGPAADEQQQLVGLLRNLDSFNWGYDPYHFNAPEGSYSSDPDSTARILEFREMVMGLSTLGLRTIMDTVYNHTNASGYLSDRSVFDKVVPGYYHRVDANTAGVLRESCCDDTAAEHAMMEKFIVDSAVQWATAYKVDGFRFDLMSFHPKSTMEEVGDALGSLTLLDDGVDGSTIYIYGEGWNFGEVGNDARFVQARQDNLPGTGIGSFNDRIRDAVRGGGPFDSGSAHLDNQGFISGQYVDPNANNSGSADELSGLLFAADRIRVGMAGGLESYVYVDANDALTTGGASGAGYTADPEEIINYIASHDGETLWDIAQYKHPAGTTTADRVRAQVLGNAILLLGQGVPFMHAGQDLLRSKSMDRNSFDSGDWFNYLDFTAMDSNFAVGLPPSWDNQASYTEIAEILGISAAQPGPADIMLAHQLTAEFLQIRNSTLLFRLRDAADILNRVSYHNTGSSQVPGMIVQSIDGCVDAALTPEYGTVVTVINARPDDQVFELFTGQSFELHPVQAASSDVTLAEAFHDSAGFHVPARTAAVFVETQDGATCSFGAAFGEQAAYLTGDFNANGFYNSMVQVGDTNWFEGTLSLTMGANQLYRIQSSDMAAIDCGGPSGGGPLFTPQNVFTTLQCGSNPDQLSLDAASDVRYKFSINTENSINPSMIIRDQAGSGFPFSGAGCGFADPGNDNSAVFGEPMFFRGNFTGWAADPTYQLINMGDGTFQAEFELAAGNLVFKIAGEDWSPEFGAPAGPMVEGEAQTVPRASGPGTDILFEVPESDCYNFSVLPSMVIAGDGAPETVDLTLSVIPQDTGEATSTPMVRGGFNGWSESDPMTMLDATTFEAVISIGAAGTQEYKVASSDWATVNCGGPQDLGAAMAVSPSQQTNLSCGQNPSNLVTDFAVPGDYTFTLDTGNRYNPTLTISPPE